jgi:hypothetical protein
MENVINFKDIVEENGKTIEQNNLSKGYKFPLGTLVKFKLGNYNNKTEKGTVYTNVEGHLYVVEHTRDCDGSPLYTLGECSTMDAEMVDLMTRGMNDMRKRVFLKGFYGLIYNMGEESLEIAPVEDPKIF